MSVPVPPLIAHVIFRLDVGGLENGLVNLINHMPSDRYRHAIICLTDATAFAQRLQKPDVEIVCLRKSPGTDWGSFRDFFQTMKRLKPCLVHTRNLAGLEYLVPAACAGVSGRVHGEHGRDTYDLDGTNWKYLTLRRLLNPLVSGYTTVSQDLAHWLSEVVGIQSSRIRQIYNGVDIDKFHPGIGGRESIGPSGFIRPESVVIGTVGRMLPVKDQLTLVRAFILLVSQNVEWRKLLRLVVVGDGPLREEAMKLLCQAHVEDLTWFSGEREDIPELLRGMDVFVLPSIAEGISNTILEAMATGLPVIATQVGGNSELVVDGQTGTLVSASQPSEMASAIGTYLSTSERRSVHGQASRARVERFFSLDAMVQGYMTVYDSVREGFPVTASVA